MDSLSTGADEETAMCNGRPVRTGSGTGIACGVMGDDVLRRKSWAVVAALAIAVPFAGCGGGGGPSVGSPGDGGGDAGVVGDDGASGSEGGGGGSCCAENGACKNCEPYSPGNSGCFDLAACYNGNCGSSADAAACVTYCENKATYPDCVQAFEALFTCCQGVAQGQPVDFVTCAAAMSGCAACKAIGVSCSLDTDCCSGNCDDWTIDGTRTGAGACRGCGSQGALCFGDSQCCNGGCSGTTSGCN